MARIIRAAPNAPGIPSGFPILVDESMRIIRSAFVYLLHTATISGRSLSPQTVRTYAEHLHDWFDSLEQSGIAWDDIEEETLAAYRNRHLSEVSQRTKRPYSLSTINDRLRTVCRFYKWAHGRGLIDELPFSFVPVARPDGFQTFLDHTRHKSGQVTANELTVRENRNIRRALTLSEVRLLMSHLTQPYRLMAEWAVATGMRRMEICALRDHQIPATDHLRSRDHPLFPIPLVVTKGKISRDVHPPLLLLDRTNQYIDEIREKIVQARRERDPSYNPDALFLGMRGQEITPKRMSDAFTKAFRAANIRAVLHCLRNTFAIRTLHALTRRQKKGEDMDPILNLRILLGHSTVAVTETYLKELELRRENLAEDIALLYGEIIEDEDVA